MNSLLWWAVMVGMIWSRLVPESYAGEIRIACLGTSITQGAGIVHRERNCYPAQLQAMLGEKYEVRNFGAGGARCSSAAIFQMTAAIVERDTSVRVLVVGPLAAGEKGSLLRTEFERVHGGLRRMNAPAGVHYSDVAFSMLNPDGSLRDDLYVPDGIHLTPDGYRVLAGLVTHALEAPALLR